jgi:hypothetical protein
MAFNHQLANSLSSRWKLRFWMLRHLPMGLMTGMRLQILNETECQVVLKDRWWIHNPFGSVFWAVMGMAAELSTGALVYAYAGRDLKFILVGMEAKFFKKVKGKSTYFCLSGPEIKRVTESLNTPGDMDVIRMPVEVKDPNDQLLAEFVFSWQLRKP